MACNNNESRSIMLARGTDNAPAAALLALCATQVGSISWNQKGPRPAMWTEEFRRDTQ